MINQNYPTLDEFVRAFVVANQSKAELIRQPLYDRVHYATAGATAPFTFFASPQGAGLSTESGGAATTPKSLADTNMTQNGQLPAPQAFWAANLQVDFDPGSVSTASLYVNQLPTYFNATAAATVQAGLNDKQAILNAGVLSFTVGTKPYMNLGPLRRFPPDARLRIDGATSMAGTNAQPAGFGTQNAFAEGCLSQPVRQLDPGVGIPTGMNFAVSIQFPIAIATGSGFNGRLLVMMDGYLLRAIQ